MEQVKVGDVVVVSGSRERLGKVIRITPTGSFEVDCMPGSLFNANGKLKGNTDIYHPVYASIATEEDVKKIREARVINKAVTLCQNLHSKDITYEQAVELLRILDTLVK